MADMRRNNRRSERGIALALVLVVGLLLSVTVAVLLQVAGLRFAGVESQRQRDASFYASEAGVQLELYKLNRKLPPFEDQSLAGWPIGDASAKKETIILDDKADKDPTNDLKVTVTVTRVSATPGPGQFKIKADTELPGTP